MIAGAVLVGALVGIAAYAVSVLVRGVDPEPTITHPAQSLAPLSDEARRLSRSAIAVGRYTPRRGS